MWLQFSVLFGSHAASRSGISFSHCWSYPATFPAALRSQPTKPALCPATPVRLLEKLQKPGWHFSFPRRAFSLLCHRDGPVGKNQKKTKTGNSPMNPLNSTGSIFGENASESWSPKQGGRPPTFRAGGGWGALGTHTAAALAQSWISPQENPWPP